MRSSTTPNEKKGWDWRLILKSLIKIILLAMALVIINKYFQFQLPEGNRDYLYVFSIGILLSAIELGSRYKDEPISVMTCFPGAFYLVINGLICCLGLFFINTFGTHEPITKTMGIANANVFSTHVANILYASLGSFFVMRSSFLKLGSDNSQSQVDLGLNIILKKMIDMIDRQVDRDQARRRSKDITRILRAVSFDSLSSRIHPFCMQVMQNIPEAEIESLFRELKEISASDDCDESKKMAIGLQIYNIVGKKLFASIIEDLELIKPPSPDNNPEAPPINDFTHSFSEIIEQVNPKGT
ncbi:Uncharacterised protein [Klebsiella pneumoniae]|uniref:hypothetical protein n=1 Tax=Klebsiella pneumoniae TaxID=573 RepID=UPI0007CA0CB7|nr:hypothetical protein [Klebsiella pneumoniae]SAT56444.1 Uncharacterised protein [Klebsiella pneumoniae]